jgi:hypothetical protein
VLVTNAQATRKFVPELERQFPILDSHDVGAGDLETLLERHHVVYLALLDRTDSAFWLDETRANAAFLDALETPREQLVEVRPTQTDRLRIWKLTLAPPVSDTPSDAGGR